MADVRAGATPQAKLLRMLRLAATHRGTHATLALAAAIALSYYSSRRAARLALRRRAIEQLIASSKPASRVQSAVNLPSLAAQSTDDGGGASARRLPRAASALTLHTTHAAPPRRPSEVALAELTGRVCEACLSRCVTHESLSKLDEETDDDADDEAPPPIPPRVPPNDEATAAVTSGATTAVLPLAAAMACCTRLCCKWRVFQRHNQ